ncbi:MAG: DUF2933 domain-containing protein [Bradyrhizobium sp.]|jgi:hypothetical protein|uniref:DUF2933 domain-containing protein n=1 Tax=Bradyrhizobium denitrificans TaxID=2734912 RepID=A0ABS5G1S3_9BRAD|nr:MULTISPECIES: DUF2933 domain-containing protein [Bradyrhizobium]MBR1135243.1 DUF2933 domain-containing protein [Bradyrhizobium denitrificans]MDU1495697.1 DUF2933 domain-containing protein [Bradyrhizobium sp.]MDU1545799.1 DUF2933 domain-containing protein [Bradyrhizobium sp.]MDU1664697.1 DUF2933 domain-containing protein [Bradyrhizobium sp.]MDU1690273.1 DUF2933 domain-containing protein [Bradyrhizobium sp.]
MSVQDHSGHQGQPREGISLKSRVGLVLVAFLVVAGALLFTEHRAHVLGLLIWLPLLACPLMHIFMHGGHHHHHGGRDRLGHDAEPRPS